MNTPDEADDGRPRSQLDRLKSQPERPQVFGPKAKPLPGDDAGRTASPRPVASPVPISHGDRPGSLSLELVRAVLDRMDAKYFVDGADAVGGIWEDGYFYFFLLREDDEYPIFQVHGQWERVLSADLYAQAAIFSNEWNAERAWPKAYARILDDDRETVGIYGELTVDFGPSVTFDQLDRAVNAGIASSLAFFDEAASTFPEAVEVSS